LNTHQVHLFCDDVKNTVNTLLDAIKERLIPHLPVRAPTLPHELTALGRVREFVVHTTPVWRNNTRVTIEGDVITVDARGADGRWLECWRSDAPDMIPVHRGQEQRDGGTEVRADPVQS
jgi:hypothetical protein